MTDISDAEIVQIATGFLLSSPPGEFMEVVTDVRGLLANDSLLNDSAPATFREYNTDQMLQVKSPKGDHQALITKYGEVNEREYLDPRGGVVVQFDHIRQEVVGSRPISGELDSGIENVRRAVDDAIHAYTAEHYPNGGSAVYGSSNTITICISSSRFNPANFWNGRWRSVWQLEGKPGSNVQIKGSVKINVHYYEDGNVQLVTNWNKSASVSTSSDPKSYAEAILKQITKLEQDYHTSLEHSYNTMGETTFKALRRVLPITRNKIDWQKIRNYKIELK